MPKFEIPLFKVCMSPTAYADLAPVLSSGYIGQGPQVTKFEAALSKFVDWPYVNTVNTGTSGLHLALHLAKAMTRDPNRNVVLTTPLTCCATNWPILANGLRIQWVDVDPTTCNIDLDDLQRKVSYETLAIMVVHWGGNPCNMDRLRDIRGLAKYTFHVNIPIIEDCAHALGATYKNKHIGTHGNFAMFSFQAIKHLTTGDGGMLLSPDAYLHNQATLQRWYGFDRTSSSDFRCAQNVMNWGFKFHMNDIAATIGLANLPHLQSVVDRHRQNGEWYNEALKDVPGLTQLTISQDNKPAYWIYTIRVANRHKFIRKMTEAGIHVSQVHTRNDMHTCVRVHNSNYSTMLPNLDVVANDMICIPCGWWVTDDMREYIAEQIKNGW